MAVTELKARTIKELRDELSRIIETHGGDLKWNGFDDGAIYVRTDDKPLINIKIDSGIYDR